MDLKNYELAEQDYMNGMKYKDIAGKYGVSLNTVKSWKTRYGWDKKGVHTKKKKVCTQKVEKEIRKEAAAEAIGKVTGNADLTDTDQLFCLYYIKSFNATRAYMKSHPGAKYETAMVNGCKALKRPEIRSQIQQLKQAKLNKAMLEPEDVFQKYMDIAFSDITDYVDFGQTEIEVIGAFGPVTILNDETGKQEVLKKKVNTVTFHESNIVDGTLISEVSQGKDGARIKLADRMKALDWLASHMDLATPEQAAKVEKLKAETEKIREKDGQSESEGVTIINDAP